MGTRVLHLRVQETIIESVTNEATGNTSIAASAVEQNATGHRSHG